MSRAKPILLALAIAFTLVAQAGAAKQPRTAPRLPGKLMQIALSVINPGPTNLRGAQRTPGYRVADADKVEAKGATPRRIGRGKQILLSIINPGPTNLRGAQRTPGYRMADHDKR